MKFTKFEELFDDAVFVDVIPYPQQTEIFKKFCLLVVDECVEWIDNNGGMIDSDTRDRLIKHFGIKNETESVSST